MTKHDLTRTYNSLKGFSTDSKYVDPAYVAEFDVNMVRQPDGTFSPRRGYQVQADEIGGLGNGIYENTVSGITEPICINKDGNLYVQKTGTMTISFNDTNNNPSSYISYEIYVDPNTISDTQTCNFDPYQVMDDSALVADGINIRFSKLTGFSGTAIGTGADNYAGVLTGFPLTPGSVLMTDGTLTIQDNASGGFYGDIGTGTNTIDYTTGAYTVSFSGVTGAVTAEYRSTLQEQFDVSVGKGYNSSSPTLISSLITLISGITDVTVTSTGSTSYPAAFIEISEETNIGDGKSVTLTWKYWESANRTMASTFSGLAAQISSDDFRNATFAPFEELIYIATGYDEVQKYDGQTVYRAGMPIGVSPTVANAGAGTILADTDPYKYYSSYEQTDATGRLVEGVLSPITLTSQIILGVNSDVTVTVTNLEQGTGWNTGGAVSSAAVVVASNTIPVDDSTGGVHSLQVGDIAYFKDGSGDYQTRNITSITSSSITIDGTAVTIDDDEPISNNLKINIYRTTAGGTIPFLLVSLANDSYSTTQNFTDVEPDSVVDQLREYPIPARQPNPPPKVGVVVSYGNQVIFTDDPINDDYVWFSEAGQPEYVPSSGDFFNNFIVPSNDDDVVGAGVSGSTLLIFKDKSIYAVSGDLITSQFTVNSISPGSNIGCVSHHTIASVGGLIYFLHSNGVYAIAETQLYPTDKYGNPIPLSYPIDKVFREDNLFEDQRYVLKRATATNYTKDSQYLLFLPCEENTGVRSANNYSRVLMYDYLGKNWFEWTRVNAAGGWYVLNDNLYWQERQKKNATITAKIFKQHRKYRLIDHVDHVTPTRVTWVSSWEDMGQPRVRKKFIRTALLFDEVSAVFQQNVPVLCFSTYKDWIRGKESTRADIMQKINSSNWSTTQRWNWISWSGYQDSHITIALKGGTAAKSLKIGLQLNQINSTFKLQGFQHEVSPDFGRVMAR